MTCCICRNHRGRAKPDLPIIRKGVTVRFRDQDSENRIIQEPVDSRGQPENRRDDRSDDTEHDSHDMNPPRSEDPENTELIGGIFVEISAEKQEGQRADRIQRKNDEGVVP